MTRSKLTLSLIAAVSVAVYGCGSPQPVAPSPATASPDNSAVAPFSGGTTAASTSANGRRFSGGMIYVTTQGLYYDTFVSRDPLPMEGKFQRLVNGTTQYGPGQPGYLGGRWWEDLNGNGLQDAGDHFFLCPLLPPGRATP
jgi:hypothetical protein